CGVAGGNDGNSDGTPDECMVNGCERIIWVGPASGGLWNLTANWCPAVVPANSPTQQYSVSIPPGVAIKLNIDATVCSLLLPAASRIDIDDTVNSNTKTFTVLNNAGLSNSGNLLVKNSAHTLQATEIVRNAGTV